MRPLSQRSCGAGGDVLTSDRVPFLSARLVAAALALGSLAALGACGDNEPGTDLDRYYARCAMPRSGSSPVTGDEYPDTKGSLADEKRFLRAWIDLLYLWYREVPDVDPASFATAVDYFDALKTPAKTASGKDKDQFHFIYPTDVWEALSQSGVEGGYGVTWALLSARPPRKIVAAYTEPGTAAVTAGIRRGAEVVSVDGVDVVNGSDVDTINGGLFPDEIGATHSFVIRDLGSPTTRTVSMVSASITSAPVQNVKIINTPAGAKVGYLTFNDHIATAEKGLMQAFVQLQAADIDDLVLDLRYNGGGYLAIAAQLGYMIAGPSATSGKTFELLTYNDRFTTTDPYGDPLTPDPFRSVTLGFSVPAGQALPSLSLPRVFVLTGPGTCSASESVMNGLRGIDVEVIQIGATTCGKPYGFVPQDNCGTTYFSIQFQGVNQKGFGDYADGFVPAGAGDAGIKGCVVADDFAHELGDPLESRLAAALAYQATGACPLLPAARAAASPLGAVEGTVVKPLWRQNRIALPRHPLLGAR
jgi:hypothetical protein